jgi:hypothetical protein
MIPNDVDTRGTSGTRRPVEVAANLKEKTMAKAKKGKGKVKKTKPLY